MQCCTLLLARMRILYGPLLVAIACTHQPKFASCASVSSMSLPAGNYTVLVGGVPTRVYCTSAGRLVPEYLVAPAIPFAYYPFDKFVCLLVIEALIVAVVT